MGTPFSISTNQWEVSMQTIDRRSFLDASAALLPILLFALAGGRAQNQSLDGRSKPVLVMWTK
jgi:hypothetical protein